MQGGDFLARAFFRAIPSDCANFRQSRALWETFYPADSVRARFLRGTHLASVAAPANVWDGVR